MVGFCFVHKEFQPLSLFVLIFPDPSQSEINISLQSSKISFQWGDPIL